MIFAAAPSEAQIEAARNAGMEFHLTPIGREAFVFFVNSKNPVEDLTVEQIRGIYTGEITNWKEVGGKNQSIRPFQRAENSGSQSALLRLMEGLPLMEPETEDRIAGMAASSTRLPATAITKMPSASPSAITPPRWCKTATSSFYPSTAWNPPGKPSGTEATPSPLISTPSPPPPLGSLRRKKHIRIWRHFWSGSSLPRDRRSLRRWGMSPSSHNSAQKRAHKRVENYSNKRLPSSLSCRKTARFCAESLLSAHYFYTKSCQKDCLIVFFPSL